MGIFVHIRNDVQILEILPWGKIGLNWRHVVEAVGLLLTEMITGILGFNLWGNPAVGWACDLILAGETLCR